MAHHTDCGLLYDDGPETCTCQITAGELVERMAAFIRRVATEPDYPCQIVDWRNEAKSLVTLGPLPVDPDLAEAATIADEALDITSACLAALKRGRQLERAP